MFFLSYQHIWKQNIANVLQMTIVTDADIGFGFENLTKLALVSLVFVNEMLFLRDFVDNFLFLFLFNCWSRLQEVF